MAISPNDVLPAWTEVHPKVFAREARLRNGRLVFFRIDGRGKKFRVDIASWPIPAWEAIDDGEGFKTFTQAQAFVSKTLKEKMTEELP